MISLSIVLLLALIAAWILGGQLGKSWRAIPVIFIFGWWAWMATHNVWIALLTAGATQAVRIGYGNYDESDDKMSLLARFWASVGLQDRTGAVIRGSWALIVSGAILLPWALLTHNFVAYATYCLWNVTWNVVGCVFRFDVFTMDSVVAMALGSALFLRG